MKAMVAEIYNSFKNSFLTEHSRWVVWLPVLLACGVGVYFALPYEPTRNAAIALVFKMGLLTAFLWRRIFWRYLFLSLLMVAIGFSAAKLRAEMVKAPRLTSQTEKITISGNIEEISYKNNFPRITLKNLRIDELSDAGVELPRKIRLNVRTKLKGDPRPGDRVITDAVLLPPPTPVKPGGFDFARWLYFNQIGATGYTLKSMVKLKTGHEESWLEDLRYRITERIVTALPGREGAVAAALITGERGKIPEEVNEIMRDSGLAHLLAISGLHLSLVAAFFFFGTRFLLSLNYRLSEKYQIKKFAAIISLIGSFAYLLISGAPVSAQRAFLMVSIMLIAVLMDRSPTPMRSVAAAAFAILLVTPEALLSAGFRMSFMAVICLIAVYEFMAEKFPGFFRLDTEDSRLKFYSRFFLYPVSVMLTTIFAGFATMPFAAFHFNRIVSYGVLANLFAVPVMTFLVMPAAVLAGILMPFGLEGIGLWIMEQGIAWILFVAEHIANFDGAVSHVKDFSITSLVVICFGMLWLFLWQTRWRWFGVIIISTGIILAMFTPKPDFLISEDSKIHVVNIDGKLHVKNRRKRFVADEWNASYGQSEFYRIPKEQTVFEVEDVTIALGCDDGADIIVADDCESEGKVITTEMLEEKGAHSVFIEDGNILIKNVADERGNRLWTD